MKIGLRNLYNNYRTNNVYPSTSHSSSSSVSESMKNYDAISIHPDSTQAAEKQFSDTLSRTIMKEAVSPAPLAKLDRVRQQLSDNTYQIDAQAIAAKMLFFTEEAAHV